MLIYIINKIRNMNITDKIKDKVKKLMALSTSSNSNEAKIALRQALYLLKKHNLNNNDIAESEIISKVITSRYTKVPPWVRNLFCDIAEALGCFTLYKQARAPYKAKFNLYGFSNDVELTHYIFDVSYQLICKQATIYKKLSPYLLSKSDIVDYKDGLSYGFAKLLKDEYKKHHTNLSPSSSKTELIPIDDRIKKAELYVKEQLNISYKADNTYARAETIHRLNGLNDSRSIKVKKGIITKTKPLERLT